MIHKNVSFLWLPTWWQTFFFLLLPGKVYADVINGLQYRVAKMQMKTEWYAQYGHEIYFWEKYDYKNRLSKKLQHKWTEIMIYFQDAFIDLDDKFLFMTWTWCLPGEQWILGFIWQKKSWLLNISPELWFLSSSDKTWYPWFHIVSYGHSHFKSAFEINFRICEVVKLKFHQLP